MTTTNASVESKIDHLHLHKSNDLLREEALLLASLLEKDLSKTILALEHDAGLSVHGGRPFQYEVTVNNIFGANYDAAYSEKIHQMRSKLLEATGQESNENNQIQSPSGSTRWDSSVNYVQNTISILRGLALRL